MRIKELTKQYDGKVVVDSVSFEIPKGSVISLIGPNGRANPQSWHGFSRLIARDSGLVGVRRDRHRQVEEQGAVQALAILTQSNNIQMKLTVRELVTFGRFPYSGGRTTQEDQAIIDQAIAYMELQDFQDRFIDELSGGQRQRVAIARALVNEPRVLLLDEPLGALDLKLREQMQLELKKLQQSLGITFIFVTHDQGEALSMSDRVAVFNNGRIEQVDSPRELYMRPRTPFVASFVGTSNVFDATMSANVCGLQGMFSLRPEHIRLNDTGGEVQARGVIQAVQYQGAATRFELKLAGGEKLLVSQANLTGEMLPSTLSPGQQVMASWSRDVMVPLVEER